MKSLLSQSHPYEEMLFSQSNKQYGAYILRTEYQNQLTKSNFIVFLATFFLLLFFSFYKKESIRNMVYHAPTVFTEIPIPSLETDEPALKPKPASKTKPPQANPYLHTDHIPVGNSDVLNPNADGVETDGITLAESFAGEGSADNNAVIGKGINEVPFQKDVSTQEPIVIEAPEVMPSFVGGEEAMMAYFNDKNALSALEIQSIDAVKKIYVEFVIAADGLVQDVKLLQSSGSNKLDKEAIRLVKQMPYWIPGKVGGEDVGVRMMLPISFAL